MTPHKPWAVSLLPLSLSSCIFSSPLFSLTSKSIRVCVWWIEPLQYHFLHPRKTRCYIQSSRRFNRLAILPRHLELLYLPLSLSFSLFHSLFLLCFFSFESLLAVPYLDITQYGPPLSTTTWNLYIVPLSLFQTGTGTLLHIPSLPLVPSPSPPLFSYILQLHRIQFMYVSLLPYALSPLLSLFSFLSLLLSLSSPLSLSLQHSLLALYSLRRLGGSWLVLG